MKTIKKIFNRMVSCNTLLCCGLDPDISMMPKEIIRKNSSNEDKILEFLNGVIDATAPHVCAYKIQKAFFDVFPGGHDALKETVSYIHKDYPGIPVIVDCKIGDIENTMRAYAANLFDIIQADGVVANPYMGDDVIEPLSCFTDKAILVLVKTSNPSSSIVQDVMLENGKPFWRHVLALTINRWNNNSNIIPVISATGNLNLKEIRSVVPNNMPIFLAGIGAQGGNYSNLKHLINSENTGVIINSSRGILYPSTDKSWRSAIEKEAVRLKNSLNEAIMND